MAVQVKSDRASLKAELQRAVFKAEPLKAEPLKAEPRVKSEFGSRLAALKREFQVKAEKREGTIKEEEERKLKAEVKCETSNRISELVERGLQLREQAERVKREVKEESLRKVKKESLRKVKKEKGKVKKEKGKGKMVKGKVKKEKGKGKMVKGMVKKEKGKRKTARRKGSAARRNASREVMNRPVALSPELAELLGARELSRPEVASRVWAHCREHGLLNPADKREVLFDERLQRLFGTSSARIFDLQSLMVPHLDYGGQWANGQAEERSAAAEDHGGGEWASSKAEERPNKVEAGPAKCEQAKAELCQPKCDPMLAELKAELGAKIERLSAEGAKRELHATSRASKRERDEGSPGVEAVTKRDRSEVLKCETSAPSLAASPVVTKRDRSEVLECETSASSLASPVATKRDRVEVLQCETSASPLAVSPVAAKRDRPEVLKCESPAAPPAASPAVLQARVRAIMPRLCEIGRTFVAVEFQAPPGGLSLEAVARPQRDGPILRQHCSVELRENAEGELEAFAESRLEGLDPAQAYRVAVEAQGVSSAEMTLPQRAAPAKWTPGEAQLWCSSLQLPDLARRVAEYRIDGATLLALGEEDLRALGLAAPFLIRRVMAGLQGLRGS